jgi:hypothetical protein
VLNIPTKINKGTVEIVAPVELVKVGEKVGSSEAALLAKLNIRPFSYGEGCSDMLFFLELCAAPSCPLYCSYAFDIKCRFTNLPR